MENPMISYVRRSRAWIGAAAIAVSALLSQPASVSAEFINLSFVNITNNGPINVASQLNVKVEDIVGSPNQVKFTITNSGSLDSVVTGVYFDDGTLLGIASLTESSGVDFTQNSLDVVDPPDLPGGNAISPPFVATAAFSSDADNPQPENGINHTGGEFLTITFNLISGQTYANVVAALQGSDPALRVGLRVQSIDGNEPNDSDGFVNNPPPGGPPPQTEVPEPASIALALVGALGFGASRLRRKRGLKQA
jgi:hypothetical protein